MPTATKDDLYIALGFKLKPIQQGINDIKKQLGTITNSVDDLDTRLREIEKFLKGKKPKKKVKVS